MAGPGQPNGRATLSAGTAKKKPKKKAPAKKARPDVSGLRPAADRDGGQPAPPSLRGVRYHRVLGGRSWSWSALLRHNDLIIIIRACSQVVHIYMLDCVRFKS